MEKLIDIDHVTAAYGNNTGSAAHIRSGNRHEPHRADADNKHHIAKLHIGQFHTVESGRNHIGEHARIYHINFFRQVRQISVSIIHMEIFRKHTVFKIRKFIFICYRCFI